MFWNNFKYNFLQTFRQKDFIIWCTLFPIIMATFFKIAFADIYNKTEKLQSIPTAVVETDKNSTFEKVLDEMAKGDSPLFKAEYTDKKTAEEKLKSGDVQIIFFTQGNDIKIETKEDGIKATIAESFIKQYKTYQTVITDTIKTNPLKVPDVVKTLSENIDTNKNIPLTKGNMDAQIQYFYNLIAMTCLFGSMSGLFVAINNQANLSTLGARNCISPAKKIVTITSDILSKYLCQFFCTFVAITYIVFVLKIDMGNKIPLVYLSGILGSILGVSMGYFIGSFGRISKEAKNAISLSVSMICSFLSGLMIGNMKILIEEYAPVVNRINPAALISDLFYCLNIYDNYSRYIEKAVSIIILSVFFVVGGVVLTRRKKYASL